MAERFTVEGSRPAIEHGDSEGIKIRRAQSLLSAGPSNYYACTKSLHFVVMCRPRQSSGIGRSGRYSIPIYSIVGACDPDNRTSLRRVEDTLEEQR